jgi:Prion-inhibition and propagation
LPEECRYLTVRLQIEQQRFLNFALEAGLLNTDAAPCNAVQNNRSLLLAVLAEIQNIFEQCARTHGKYKAFEERGETRGNQQDIGTDLIELLCAPPSYRESLGRQAEEHLKTVHKLGKGLARTGSNLRRIVVEPKRLVWATLDKARFEGFLSRLAELNCFLIALLDNSQAKRLQHAMDVSYQELLHIRNDIASLTYLLEALKDDRAKGFQSTQYTPGQTENPLSKNAAEESKFQQSKQKYLLRLTKIKLQLSRLSTHNDDSALSTRRALELGSFDFEDAEGNNPTFTGRSDAVYKRTPVWIEWKGSPYSPRELAVLSKTEHALIETRIRLLVELLRDEKPEGFRSPTCVGYVKHTVAGEPRYGIVFEKTGRKYASAIRIRTLHDLLQERPKPSLSARISLCASLAHCVYSFHSVDWLHKGLRSENVVFFQPTDAQVDIRHPYVTGFELSRPIEIDYLTEKPAYNPAEDIYRHPLAQSILGSGKFRSVYDIYALGILLVEIANWKRIDCLLGFQDMSVVKPQELRNVHRRLLEGPTHLQRLARKSGDAFVEAVILCLNSDALPREQNEGTVSMAMRLQGILQDVVAKLRAMEIATGTDP